MKRYVALFNIGVMAMVIGFSTQSCVEPFEPEAIEFKSALVIEATITDENINQEIKVSRTFALDTTGIYGERGAKITVIDANGAVYDFSEEVQGTYISQVPFAAQTGLGYSLSITTADGTVYSSEQVTTPEPTQIDNLYAERDFKDNGVNEGMFIYVDSFDPTGININYRYEYEETYKIIAPFWSPADAFVVTPFPNPTFETRRRTKEERTCYQTNLSKNIIQENTLGLNENRITKFPVRFIPREDYILTNRYSILVKQYIQSNSAFSYYETLEALSGSSSLFSQIQTGFLEGNIKSESDRNEQVIGFFEVSSVSEKRIYFKYADFFPGERLPDYVIECPLLEIQILSGVPPNRSPLADAIESGTVKFYNDNKSDSGNTINDAPFLMVSAACSDCTELGSNVVPDFWVEENEN